jgi:hypothetical protein
VNIVHDNIIDLKYCSFFFFFFSGFKNKSEILINFASRFALIRSE